MFGGHPPALKSIVGRSKGTYFSVLSKQERKEIARKYTLGYQVIVITSHKPLTIIDITLIKVITIYIVLCIFHEYTLCYGVTVTVVCFYLIFNLLYQNRRNTLI